MTGGNGELERAASLWPEDEAPIPLLGASTAEKLADHAVSQRRPGRKRRSRFRPRERASADDFSAERMLRATADAPARGWRRGVYRLTGGLVRVGPSASELRHRELVARVKTPVARLPQDRVHLTQGRRRQDDDVPARRPHVRGAQRRPRDRARRQPRRRHARPPRPSRDDRDLDIAARGRRAGSSATPTSAATRRRRQAGSRSSRPTTTRGSRRRSARPSSERAIELLERHYNLVCLDTGTGVLESATRGILDAADQIVVVSAPSLDGARAASSTLDWLEQNGYQHLVEGAVAVLNAVRRDERRSSTSTGSSTTSPSAAAPASGSHGTRTSTRAPRPTLDELRPADAAMPTSNSRRPIASGFSEPTERRS